MEKKHSNIKKEYESIHESNQWCSIYQKIKDESELDAKKLNFTLDASRMVQNKRLNRYRDVNPYDHSRIILKRNNIDYINANLVKHEKAKRNYILCQGPLEFTVSHFWLMIWEQQSKAILMLNKIIEKKQIKCHTYWPQAKEKLKLTDVGLTVEFLQVENYKNFCKRLFKITDIESTKTREVIQFHYTQWPDFGVPETPTAFLQFLKQVRDSGVLDEDVGPAVIHCSAGIGRSGTFCLVDCCLVLFENEDVVDVSVKDVLLELRKGRMGLIQTSDQLSFSYEAIIEGIERMEKHTFNELDCLEIATASDEEENAPPVPPRTISNFARNLPECPPSIGLSDSSDSTSSDVSTIPEDPSDSENELDDEENNFDANSKLPPLPNGTNDLSDMHTRNTSEEERAKDTTNELRHRQRNARNERMEDKIREIKRKTKEAENWPKKRRNQTPQDK